MAYQKKASEKQQLPDQKSGAPSSNQSSSILNSQERKPGDLAREEFNRIKNMLNNISLKQQFASSTNVECEDNPSWCLPNVNCTARATMRTEAKKAFERNKKFCNTPIK